MDFVEGKTVDFNTMSVGAYDGTVEKGKASIVKYDNQNVLRINTKSDVRIIEGFEADPLAKYTTTFWARADKDISFTITFSGQKVDGPASEGKWTIKQGKWTKFVIESQSAADETNGYLRIENGLNGVLYIQKVQVGYYPDNHRPQTAQELNDTINYAVNAWCDGVMKINEGRIKSFDLIDEALDPQSRVGEWHARPQALYRQDFLARLPWQRELCSGSCKSSKQSIRRVWRRSFRAEVLHQRVWP